MKKLYENYKEVILYLVFGVLTTVVNIATFYVFDDILHVHYLLANLIAWLLAVLFAYETNRRFVFSSKQETWQGLLKEFMMFVSCRLFSGACDMAIMFIGIDMMMINSMLVKIASNIVVVVLNYIFSKLLIFKK